MMMPVMTTNIKDIQILVTESNDLTVVDLNDWIYICINKKQQVPRR